MPNFAHIFRPEESGPYVIWYLAELITMCTTQQSRGYMLSKEFICINTDLSWQKQTLSIIQQVNLKLSIIWQVNAL